MMYVDEVTSIVDVSTVSKIYNLFRNLRAVIFTKSIESLAKVAVAISERS